MTISTGILLKQQAVHPGNRFHQAQIFFTGTTSVTSMITSFCLMFIFPSFQLNPVSARIMIKRINPVGIKKNRVSKEPIAGCSASMNVQQV
jgi:hypothetical protein